MNQATWKRCLLGDFLTLKRGYDLPTQDRVPGLVPIISSSGISGWHNQIKVKGPGVVTGRYGTLGQVFYMDCDFWPLNTSLYVSDFKGNDPRFACYLLITLNLATQNAAGAVPGVNRNHLHRLNILVPELSLQRRIATILAAYDDLIENNTRRITILEDMARLIYQEWFVRFRFPGHDSVRMVESELGLIPEGWEVKCINAVSSFINRGISPEYDDQANCVVINQKCIRNQQLRLEYSRRQRKRVPENKLVRFGDVLINSTGIGTLGRVAQARDILYNCTIDSHVTLVRPVQDMDINFFGLALFSLQSHFEGLGVGATGQTELGRSRIADTLLIIPPRGLRDSMGEIVRPMRMLSQTIASKNANLRAQRDLLLPKLISGEIDVAQLTLPGLESEAA